uniref:Uncharacterized protein n=1 Tax=Ralstonia solanacearum TaxID=305 RepID=A0A0S4V4P2_RALSL|nr:protein of unknown function [Ralstonia solanacearum]
MRIIYICLKQKCPSTPQDWWDMLARAKDGYDYGLLTSAHMVLRCWTRSATSMLQRPSPLTTPSAADSAR